jgi:hypothetical protein
LLSVRFCTRPDPPIWSPLLSVVLKHGARLLYRAQRCNQAQARVGSARGVVYAQLCGYLCRSRVGCVSSSISSYCGLCVFYLRGQSYAVHLKRNLDYATRATTNLPYGYPGSQRWWEEHSCSSEARLHKCRQISYTVCGSCL